jgi:hypothetical protein
MLRRQFIVKGDPRYLADIRGTHTQFKEGTHTQFNEKKRNAQGREVGQNIYHDLSIRSDGRREFVVKL